MNNGGRATQETVTEYLAFVQRHPCIGCKAEPPSLTQRCAHLEMPFELTDRGSNVFVVPLCSSCRRLFISTGTVPKLNVSTTFERVLIVQAKLMASFLMGVPPEHSGVERAWPVF